MALWGRDKDKQKVKAPDSNLMTAHEFVRLVREKERFNIISVNGVLHNAYGVEAIGDMVFFNSAIGLSGVCSASYNRSDISTWPMSADDIESPEDWVGSLALVEHAERAVTAVFDTVNRTKAMLEPGQPLTFMKDIHGCYRAVIRFFPDHSWIDIGWKGPLIVADNDNNHAEVAGIIPASTKVYSADHVLAELAERVEAIGNIVPASHDSMATLNDEFQKLRDLITSIVSGDDLIQLNDQ